MKNEFKEEQQTNGLTLQETLERTQRWLRDRDLEVAELKKELAKVEVER